MLAGQLYSAADPELQAELAATSAWLAHYNAACVDTPASSRHQAILGGESEHTATIAGVQ